MSMNEQAVKEAEEMTRLWDFSKATFEEVSKEMGKSGVSDAASGLIVMGMMLQLALMHAFPDKNGSLPNATATVDNIRNGIVKGLEGAGYSSIYH